MSSAVDVVVVGGGPAGSATAIWSATSGLRVTLLERRRFPRHRPGETLHPGVEPVLDQLGVGQQVAEASLVRHDGVCVDWGGRRETAAFGGAEGEAWLGYQILREELDSILLGRARDLGVDVVQPASAAEPVMRNGRVVGVRSGGATMPAGFVVDASGAVGWLRRRLGLGVELASPPLRAYYGYREEDVAGGDGRPRLLGDRGGWTWTARVGPARMHWTRLAITEEVEAHRPPSALSSLRPLGRTRCADVTWRQVRASAGPGYFLVGDAAMVLDPAASHGVLRALMTGMMAGHAIRRTVAGDVTEPAAISDYRTWTDAWFHHDVRHLSTLYRELQPSWPEAVSTRSSAPTERRARWPTP